MPRAGSSAVPEAERGDSAESLLQKLRVPGEQPGWGWAQVVNVPLWIPAPSAPFLLSLMPSGEQEPRCPVHDIETSPKSS